MTLKKIYALSLLLSFFAVGYAQIRVHGKVTEREAPLTDVVIEKYVNGKRSADVLANNKGKYAIDIPFNVLVELIFKADKKVPLKLTIDTHPLSFSTKIDQSYDVPFNMELFPYYSDIVDQLDLEQSFGSIAMSGTGTATFQFKPKRSTLMKIKEAKAEAFRLFDSGVEAEVVSKNESKPTSSATIEQEVKMEERAEQEKIQERVVEKIVDNTEKLVEAKSEEMRQAREGLAKEQALSETKENTQQDHQSVNKQNKADAYFERQRNMEKSTDMRIQRHEDAELLASSGGIVNQKSESNIPRLITQRTTKSTFLEATYTQYVIGEKTNVLECKRYDWKLFHTEYYYLNGEEITKEKYELEKRSVL